MKLILQNPEVCNAFGVPAKDTTDEEIIADYVSRAWDKEQAARHLQCAIDAGAYRMAPEKKEKTK